MALAAGSEGDVDPATPAASALPLTETSEVWRAAHRRLYEHLRETTNEGDQPTLEQLQPLYQAVAHGCHAGLQQDAFEAVFFARIHRGTEYHAIHKLGAYGANLGALACFFERPWDRPSPRSSADLRSSVLAGASYDLRANGRLVEALEPIRASAEDEASREQWEYAAIGYSNLSELELTLGEVSGALSDAERSVTYADRSADAFERQKQRAKHADALHQSGRRSEAESHFREAEQMQAERQPTYPLLYSTGGFMYCDLLLAPAEQEVWRTLNSKSESRNPKQIQNTRSEILNVLDSCRDVTDRATQTLKIAEDNNLSLLTIALDHLTLSRAALYESLLSGSEISDSASPISQRSSEIEAAVSGLRRAGTTHHLPRGLLTRAWQRSLLASRTGTLARLQDTDGQECPSYWDSAQSDLDEAWEIASRGPMPLFLADIHLYRVRLFGEPRRVSGRAIEASNGDPTRGLTASGSQYPWQAVEHDLAEARRLIEKHGYGRRLEELEDAERALLLQNE